MKTVFAIGDSWLNYFFTDLYRVLQDRGFAVERVALPGETLASIASGARIPPAAVAPRTQLARLKALIDGSPTPPTAILLSAGGDDVVAPDETKQRRLKFLLNRAEDGAPALIAREVRKLVDVEIRNDLATVLAAITALCRARYPGKTIPILVHGYAHPVADGRRGPFEAGPWLGPVFAGQGYGVDQMRLRLTVMKRLIDRLNKMQMGLVKEPRFSHVVHIDMRTVLSSKSRDYREHWENELHPTRHGFQLVGARLAEVLHSLS